MFRSVLETTMGTTIRTRPPTFSFNWFTKLAAFYLQWRTILTLYRRLRRGYLGSTHGCLYFARLLQQNTCASTVPYPKVHFSSQPRTHPHTHQSVGRTCGEKIEYLLAVDYCCRCQSKMVTTLGLTRPTYESIRTCISLDTSIKYG